jgi:ectoine hydroxylase-related dioxygenase (phytanoyl-CoA dioxygenase family)
LPSLRELTDHAAILKFVRGILGDDAFVARATLFNKTPDANWKVPWHQDVTIAVKEKREAEGYGPWSVKAGVVHVQPPSEVLERMLTVRVHIDPCHATNGALKVMPGSHRFGKLDQNNVDVYLDEQRSVCCTANAGDALLMRPLLLHASSAAVEPTHRRVLHFDYAAGDLVEGLHWKMRD